MAATVNHGTGQVRAVDEGDVSRSAFEVGIRHGSIVNRDSTTNFSIHIVNFRAIVYSEVTINLNGDVALTVINNGGFAGNGQVAGGINSSTILYFDVVQGDITLAIIRGSGGHRTADVAIVQADVTTGGGDGAINHGVTLTLLSGGKHIASGIKHGITIHSKRTAHRYIAGHGSITVGDGERVHGHITSANNGSNGVEGQVTLVLHEHAVHGNSSLATSCSGTALDGQTALAGHGTQINLLVSGSGVVDIQLRVLIKLGGIGSDIKLLQVHLAGIAQFIAVNLHLISHNGGNTLHAGLRSNYVVVELDNISGQRSIAYQNRHGSGRTSSCKNELTGISLVFRPAACGLSMLFTTQRTIIEDFVPLTVSSLTHLSRAGGIRPVTGDFVCSVCITAQRRSRLTELLRAEVRVIIRICVIHAGTDSDNSRNEAGTQFYRQM